MKTMSRLLAVTGAAVLTVSVAGCGGPPLEARVSCKPALTKGGDLASTYTYHFKTVKGATVTLRLRSPGAKSDDSSVLLNSARAGVIEGKLSYTWANPSPGYRLVLMAAKDNNTSTQSHALTALCPDDISEK
jgi:hypothetical protein